MKTIRKVNVCRPVAAMILTAALAATALAEHQVPFKGGLQGEDTDIASTSSSVTVLTVGTGIATHLGRFSFTQTVTVHFATGTSTGTAQFFAANGDSISTTVSGSGKAIQPGLFDIQDVHTIIGGTGRFAGAEGSFTVKRVASGVTFLTSGSFDGSITPASAAH